MPTRKKGSARKTRKTAKKTAKKTARPRKSKIELSRSRGHIPVELLKSRLAKMPRHMHSLANLIKQRQRAGE